MRYSEKLRKIRPFVNIKININRKNFTTAEKQLISRYYNLLKRQGYFDKKQVGYRLVSIKGKRAPKIKGAPRITQRFVEVGTVIRDGKVITNPARRVKIRGGKIYVEQAGAPRIWRFEYDIAREWTVDALAAHLEKQIGKKNLRKTQFFAIGAGIRYQVENSISDSLRTTAREIIKLGNRYTADFTESYFHENQEKMLSDWLQEIVVYEDLDEVASRQKGKNYYNFNKKPRKKRRKKKARRKL